MEVDIVRKCLGKNVDEIVVPADIAKGPAKPFSAWPTCCNIRQVKLSSVTINLMAQDRKIKIIETIEETLIPLESNKTAVG